MVKLDRISYERNAVAAEELLSISDMCGGYLCDGYLRGLQRNYIGESYGTESEHCQLLARERSKSKNEYAYGLGYRLGCEGANITDLVIAYRECLGKKETYIYLTMDSPRANGDVPAVRINGVEYDGPSDTMQNGQCVADFLIAWAIGTKLDSEDHEALFHYLKQWPEGPQIEKPTSDDDTNAKIAVRH